jgi:hypothetical protein
LLSSNATCTATARVYERQGKVAMATQHRAVGLRYAQVLPAAAAILGGAPSGSGGSGGGGGAEGGEGLKAPAERAAADANGSDVAELRARERGEAAAADVDVAGDRSGVGGAGPSRNGGWRATEEEGDGRKERKHGGSKKSSSKKRRHGESDDDDDSGGSDDSGESDSGGKSAKKDKKSKGSKKEKKKSAKKSTKSKHKKKSRR